MENDRENNEYNDDDEAQADRAEVGPGGILAGNLTAGSPASGIMSGMVGGGPGSRIAANQDVDEDTAERSTLNLDALDGLGNRQMETGDNGVSPQQRELEAGEMNG